MPAHPCCLHSSPLLSAQILLFGYEFPDTICVAAGNEMLVFASAKKLQYLQGAATLSEAPGAPVRIRLLPREKGDDTVPANRAALDLLLAAIAAAGNKVGTFARDPTDGPIAQAWRAELDRAGATPVDATRGAEGFLAVKDATALEETRAAGKLACSTMKRVMVKVMEDTIDVGENTTNRKVAEKLKAIVDEREKLERNGVAIDTDNFDSALPAQVQSGGRYTIAIADQQGPNAGSSDEHPFSYDVIVMSVGMRYKGMRSLCARTYMVDPTPGMKKIYDAIEGAHRHLISKLRPGAVIKDVCAEVRDALLQSGIPMTAKIGRNFGSGIGARLTDKFLTLNIKNEAVITEGMVFNVSVCLSDIPLEDRHPVASAAVNKLQSYAVALCDTVIVTAGDPEVATSRAPRSSKDVSYEMAGADDDDDEEDEEDEDEDEDGGGKKRKDKKKDKKKDRGDGSGRGAGFDPSAGRDSRGRSARLAEKQKEVDPDAARKLEERQVAIVEKMKEAALKKIKKAKGGDGADDSGAEDDIENAPDIVCYRSTADFPRGVRGNQIIVDKSRDCVLVPLLGTLVPFHISTIKSVVKSDEGAKSLLRINFYSAGAAVGKDAAPAIAKAVRDNENSVFVRTLNFMSRDHRNFTDVDLKIKAMLKAQRTQRKEEKETSGLVEQPRLILKKENVGKVVDIHMWPPYSGRGRTQGTLAAHANGLLFNSNKGERLEIIYSNIKPAIFQPCEGEHVVLIHFHLKHSIMIGKKRYRDIQFYTEVIETSQTLDNARRGNDYDQDELEEEERERKLRATLNKAYKHFVTKVEDAAALDPMAGSDQFRTFEVPSRDLIFTGAWAKEMTTILLGATAIVSVVDKPPLVISVDDIELVHFERVVNGGKSFDMSIVFKAGVADKGLDEFVRISSIEMRHKSNICVWLTEVAEVIWTEGPESINWKLLIQEQVREPYFWLDEDEDGNPKNIGMVEVLTPFEEGAGGEDGEEEGSGEESEEYEESDDGEDDDDDDDVSLVDEDEDDDDDSDASEEEDEEEEDEDEMDESDVSSEKPKKKKK